MGTIGIAGFGGNTHRRQTNIPINGARRYGAHEPALLYNFACLYRWRGFLQLEGGALRVNEIFDISKGFKARRW